MLTVSQISEVRDSILDKCLHISNDFKVFYDFDIDTNTYKYKMCSDALSIDVYFNLNSSAYDSVYYATYDALLVVTNELMTKLQIGQLDIGKRIQEFLTYDEFVELNELYTIVYTYEMYDTQLTYIIQLVPKDEKKDKLIFCSMPYVETYEVNDIFEVEQTLDILLFEVASVFRNRHVGRFGPKHVLKAFETCNNLNSSYLRNIKLDVRINRFDGTVFYELYYTTSNGDIAVYADGTHVYTDDVTQKTCFKYNYHTEMLYFESAKLHDLCDTPIKIGQSMYEYVLAKIEVEMLKK